MKIKVKTEEKVIVNSKERIIEKTIIKKVEKYGFCNNRLQLVGHLLYPEAWPYSQGLVVV